jgi:hypothetical protein
MNIITRYLNELLRRKQRDIKETMDDRPKGRGIEPSPASGGIKNIENWRILCKFIFILMIFCLQF